MREKLDKCHIYIQKEKLLLTEVNLVMEYNPRWKTTIDGRQPLVEDILMFLSVIPL